MQKKILYSQLKTFLFELQFILVPMEEKYLVFRHPESEALIALPHYEPDAAIAKVHLILIRRILIEYGLGEEESFNDFLEKVTNS